MDSSLEISNETRRRLLRLSEYMNETPDEIIHRLLDFAEHFTQATSAALSTDAVESVPNLDCQTTVLDPTEQM